MKIKANFSIKYKLMILTAILSLSAIVAVTVLFMLGFKKHNDSNINNISRMTGNLASETYDSTLQAASGYNEKIVSKQADITDEKLKNLREKTELICEMAEGAYAEANISYKKSTGKNLDLADSLFYVAPDVAITEDIIKEENVLRPVLAAIMQYSERYPAYANVFVLTKSGIIAQSSGTQLYQGMDLRVLSEPYIHAMENPDQFSWSQLYDDSVRGLCITGAMSYAGADGEPAGVVAIDVYIDELSLSLEGAKIGEYGKVFMIAPSGDYHQIVPSETFNSDITSDVDWLRIFREIRDGEEGHLQASYGGRDYYLYYDSILETGWKFCSMIDDSELAKSSEQIQNQLTQTMAAVEKTNTDATRNLIFMLIVAVIVLIIAIIIASMIFAHKFAEPILNLAEGTEKIGSGNLDIELPVESNDEIGELTVVINQMTQNLKKYIDELTTTTAAKEKVEAEMDMAAQIQDGMIPDDPIDVAGTHIEGIMRPAKSVGGDFFDYFMIDDDHLGFIIADVSDKGVPAALFMAIGRTLLREVSLTGAKLSDVFIRVNNILARNNENMQFITVFEGILELSTGHMRYANAGHEKPFIKKSSGLFEMYDTPSAMPLGLMEDIEYTEESIVLEPGDIFFQYTDGATDSVNPDGVMLEETGIEVLLNKLDSKEIIENQRAVFVNQMLTEIDEHAAGADQFDDITMILVRYKNV